MAMKEYSKLYKSPELEHHQQIQLESNFNFKIVSML